MQINRLLCRLHRTTIEKQNLRRQENLIEIRVSFFSVYKELTKVLGLNPSFPASYWTVYFLLSGPMYEYSPTTKIPPSLGSWTSPTSVLT